MIIKDLWLKTSNWLQSHRPLKTTDYQPQIGNDGLISQNGEQMQFTTSPPHDFQNALEALRQTKLCYE